VDVRIKPGTEAELVRSYAELIQTARRQPGFIGHQLCQSVDDPDMWMVISEWDHLEASTAWDRSEEHMRLLGPMRACFAEAARGAFNVRNGISAL
jgi:heme-degrading monooxygenase HmoA